MGGSTTRLAAIGIGLAGAALVTALMLALGSGADESAGSATSSPANAVPAAASGDRSGSESALERIQARIGAKPGSMRRVGTFGLGRGRTLRLYTAQAADGASCLIDEADGLGAGSTCLESGLFHSRRAAFSVNSNGGPERFGELQVVGMVAPEIGSLTVVLTDGSVTEAALNEHRAFLYESTVSDLARDALPAALRLYGRNGRLVETISIPALR